MFVRRGCGSLGPAGLQPVQILAEPKPDPSWGTEHAYLRPWPWSSLPGELRLGCTLQVPEWLSMDPGGPARLRPELSDLLS